MGQFQNFGSSSQRKTDIVATPTKKRALLAVADGAQSTHGVPALGIDPPDLQLASPAPSHCATEAPNMSRALSRNHRHTAIDWEMSACWGGGGSTRRHSAQRDMHPQRWAQRTPTQHGPTRSLAPCRFLSNPGCPAWTYTLHIPHWQLLISKLPQEKYCYG